MEKRKKIGTKVVIIVLLLCCQMASAAFAQEFYRGAIEHVDATMPNIDVYFNIIDDNDVITYVEDITKDDVGAMLSDETLKVEDTIAYSQSEKGTAYFFVVDISKSVDDDFDEVKSALINWVDNKKEQDDIVLVTFGEEVEVRLEGNESDEEIKEAINSLTAIDQQTKFFDGVYRALNVAQSENVDLESRKVFIVVTDGEDYSEGGVTSEELSQAMIDSGIPMYNVAVSTSEGDDKSELGELSRSTGAKLVTLQRHGIEAIFQSLQNELNSGYLISLKAKNNVLDWEEKNLSVNIENDTIKVSDDKKVVIDKYEEDDEKPDFDTILVRNENEIEVRFSEDVIGADKVENFSLENKSGNLVSIKQCNYEDGKVKLILEDSISNGEYTLNVTNIYDDSMEQNEMYSDSIKINVKNLEKEILSNNGSSKSIIFILLGVGAAIAVLLYAINAKNKKDAQKAASERAAKKNTAKANVSGTDVTVNQKVHVPNINGKKINLVAVSPDGVQKVLEAFIPESTSLLIGRSTACDIYFDDLGMSRQHCRISYSNNALYIEDLGSSNGTQINGVPLNGTSILNEGDVLEMGKYKVIYRS